MRALLVPGSRDPCVPEAEAASWAALPVSRGLAGDIVSVASVTIVGRAGGKRA